MAKSPRQKLKRRIYKLKKRIESLQCSTNDYEAVKLFEAEDKLDELEAKLKLEIYEVNK